jgi:hypothetical protein
MNRSPSENEAAAIAAAIERFLAETAPASGGEHRPVGPWQRAALREGADAEETVHHREGGDRWLW